LSRQFVAPEATTDAIASLLKQVGLIGKHAYALKGLYTTPRSGTNLVCLVNPWLKAREERDGQSSSIWNGAWSDSSADRDTEPGIR